MALICGYAGLLSPLTKYFNVIFIFLCWITIKSEAPSDSICFNQYDVILMSLQSQIILDTLITKQASQSPHWQFVIREDKKMITNRAFTKNEQYDLITIINAAGLPILLYRMIYLKSIRDKNMCRAYTSNNVSAK